MGKEEFERDKYRGIICHGVSISYAIISNGQVVDSY